MASLIASLTHYFTGYEKCICITGGGGKTTALILLAQAYAEQNKRVLVSTTTKLQFPEQRAYDCDTYFYNEDILHYQCKGGERVFYGNRGTSKIVAPDPVVLETLCSLYDVLLLEADGAAQRGLKLHTDRDPVIPPYCTAALAVASFALIGKSLKENCFGCETWDEQSITVDTYRRLLSHPQGITKALPKRQVILFNQAEQAQREDIRLLAQQEPSLPLWFGSLHTNTVLQRNTL